MTVNLGLRPLEIELLYFEGCPGYNETLGIVRKTVVEEGLAARVVPVVLEYDDNRPGFSGSPTVPVDGEDLFTAGHHAPGQGCAMSCRIYSTPQGQKNHPTAAMVREALSERLSEG